jgi:colanic acid/amylovoran biosynthesis protein
MGRKPFIGLMGASLATGNRGVSALGASLVKLSYDAYPEADAVMLISNRDSKPFKVIVEDQPRIVQVANFRVSPTAEPRKNLFFILLMALLYRVLRFRWSRRSICRCCPWIEVVEQAELVGDIRGGDSFSDIYGLYNFVIASLPVIAVILIRGTIVLFPQTYGPFKHRHARIIARYILRRADNIFSRDEDSLETVRKLIGSTTNARFCPDVAFVLDPVQPATREIEPPIPAERTLVIGLNINGLMYNGGYTQRNMFGLKLDYRAFLTAIIGVFLEMDGVHLLLVPHTFTPPGDVESDPHACRLVKEAISETNQSRVHLITREYDQHEIKGIIGGCDFFIGSRLHSCIAALSQGIPTVGVAYSKKFEGVFGSVGMADWIVDGRTTSSPDAVREVHDHFTHRSEIRTPLAIKVARAKSALNESFASLFERANS